MIEQPNGATLVLLTAADDDLRIALKHIEAQNFGLAADWINAARAKLPQDTGIGGIEQWPRLDHFQRDNRFEYRPEYATLRDS